jgi:hypothetical protein
MTTLIEFPLTWTVESLHCWGMAANPEAIPKRLLGKRNEVSG